MPQAYEAARREGLEQVLGCDTAGGIVEVDQHVSAEDDIENAMLARFRCLGDIGRAELDRLAQFGDDETTRKVIARVQAEGTCWAGGAFWQGKHAMRIAVSNWSTTEADIDRSADAMVSCYRGS